MKLISQLEKYAQSLQEKTEEITKAVVQEGERIMQTNLDNAEYSGSLKSHVEMSQNKNSGEISLVGSDAGFIEFGTGTHYPDNHPQASEFGAIRGRYGKGYGENPPWTFTDTTSGTTGEYYGTAKFGVIFETMGNPANRVVYNTARELERTYLNIAKEVFKND